MEEYRTNVTLVIDDEVRDNLVAFGILDDLQEYGLSIDKVDHDMGVISGYIPTTLVHGLKRRLGVGYVRETSTYLCKIGEDCREDEAV